MHLVIDRRGQVVGVYDEALDLATLGDVRITRAGHVEPDDRGRWWANLSPVGGPRLGPFGLRSTALLVEREWLDAALAQPGFLAVDTGGGSP